MPELIAMYQIDETIDGKYRVLKVFTNGGMGVVYKVHHADWNMDIAMKCPRRELFSAENSKKSFIKECRTWMDLGVHPNVVTCFYVKSVDSTPAIFLEYADGGSLADVIKAGLIYSKTPADALKRILDIAIQTARGLRFAHGKGYIHQDIKPANILMTSKGVVKVSDFGLSRASRSFNNNPHFANQIHENERSVMVSSGGCTPAYCSPEQIFEHSISRRTDIWTWALMFLEMIHGGIFWRIGAEASQRLNKLWTWQVFSPKVKKCPEFLGLIKECLNEDADKRPHDFSSIENRLVSIYSSMFGDYPLRHQNETVLSAGTLCNRIASYSALDEYDKDVSGEVFKVWNELRKYGLWFVWGDINYSVYGLNSGMRIAEIVRLLKNAFMTSNSLENKEWIVSTLLSIGQTSPQCFDLEHLAVNKELHDRICRTHSSLRDDLKTVVSGAKHTSSPFNYVPFQYYVDGGSDAPLEKNADGYFIGGAISENNHCHVSIFLSNESLAKGNSDRTYIVTVEKDNKSLSCSCQIPKKYVIRFVTVDDNCSMLSLWLSAHIDDENIFYRYVIRKAKDNLCPFIADYRRSEKWGRLAKIFQSGDAKRLMTINKEGVCSIWINEDANPRKDGRNVCEINLNAFGLIPPEILLPNFKLEEGFEYEIDAVLGYRLMDHLADKFGNMRHPCKIFLPDTSEEIEMANLQGQARIADAKCAENRGRFADEARLLSEAILFGVILSEEKASRRHRIVTSCRTAFIHYVWLADEQCEPWKEKLALFQAQNNKAYEAFFLPTWQKDPDGKHEEYIPYIVLLPIGDKSVLAIRLKQTSSGYEEVAIGRYHIENERKYPNFDQLQPVWEHAFKEPALGLRTELSSCIKICGDMVEVLLHHFGIVLSLNLDFGTIVEEQKLTENRNFAEKILDTNGNKSVVDVGWSLVLRDNRTRRDEQIIDYRLLPYSHFVWRWALMSRITNNGLAIAVITLDLRLIVYCVNSHKVVFDWQLSDGNYLDMCFDTTGRWLSVLCDNHDVLTFQLFWDADSRNINLNR